ncbi:MAG: leucine-rich repeat domain-containing protein [Clostridiales bacterium]|nr:leucine-rich repeat domain-containing protein [Clostridiales bacterium]
MKTTKGEFNIQSGTVLKYRGEDEELTLPKNVVRIAPYAFAGCKTLKKVTTPVKLASIGKGAFFGCDNLVEVTIPGRLFRRVNGGKVFPSNADIYFRFYASAGAQSEDEDYSDRFGSEEEYVASGVNDVERAFKDEVQSEEIITIVEEFPIEPEPEADLGDGDKRTLQERMDAIIPNDPTGDPDLQRNSLVNLSDYLIVDDEVIKYIGTHKVTQVPDFITRIGENAFSNRDVEKVILPPRLKLIGKNAFSWCEKLTEIVMPDSLQMIDDGAFSNCSNLVTVKLPAELRFIGANAFRACSSVKEFDLPETLHTISRRAFDFCVSVEKITVPQGIMRLAEGVFSHCENLRKVTLPDNLTEIGAWAFAECYELREINFPQGLQSICEVAFMNCRSLVAFDLPRSLKTLGRQAFVGCTSLHLVNAPKQLEKQIKPTKAFHKLSKLSINYYEDEAGGAN